MWRIYFYMERVYCISLKDNEVRRRLMSEQLEKEFRDKYEIIDAITINDKIVMESYNNITLKDTNITALSQIAICYSHLECLKKIEGNKLRYGGIIEDDIRMKGNTNEKINNYIESTSEIKEIMRTEPCILHICGPYNYVSNINKFKDSEENTIIVNICFYIVNHQLAKILIDNFYPIKYQFDTYVYKMVKQYKVREYTACPILAWDLSSTLYRNFWTVDDIKIKKHIITTSTMKNIKEVIKMPKMISNDKKYYKNILRYEEGERNEMHYLMPNMEIKLVNENTIIAGNGIKNIKDIIPSPLIVLFVRGPMTKKKMDEQGIKCPEIYLEPLIYYENDMREKNNKEIQNQGNTNKSSKNISESKGNNITKFPIKIMIEKFEKTEIIRKDPGIKNKYIFLLSKQENRDNISGINYVNIENIEEESIVKLIKSYENIVSDVYEILVLTRVFNKNAFPIIPEEDLRYMDYLQGYKSIKGDIKYLTLEKIIKDLEKKIEIEYPQIEMNEITEKIKELSKYDIFKLKI